MLRILYFIKRHPELDRELFWSYWKSDQHKTIIEGMAEILGCESYSDTMVLKLVTDLDKLAPESTKNSYDAVLDFRLSHDDFSRATSPKIIQYLNQSRSHSEKWIDFENSITAITARPCRENDSIIYPYASLARDVPASAVRMLYCFKRRPDLSSQEFKLYWEGQEQQNLLAAMAEGTKADSYSSTGTVHSEAFFKAAKSYSVRTLYDAVVDFRWKDARTIKEIAADENVLHFLSLIRAKRRPWTDFQQSCLMLTEGPSMISGNTKLN